MRPSSSEPAQRRRPKPVRGAADRADFAACAEAIRHGSHSFHAAGKFLPQRLRLPSHAIYAFCRLADDAVDETDLPLDDAVARLRVRLDRAYQGRPLDIAADRAFARTVEAFEMPRTLPEALIEGLAWDADGRRYATLSELNAYAARVAGAVGGMMAVLLGERSAEMLARACDLGVAMQLTNIARDVGEDARRGRVYLPLDWLEKAGIDPERLIAAPAPSPQLAAVLKALLAEADKLYIRAEAGIARLPKDCRPAIFAARFLYAEIGHEVARRGYDSITGRAVVSKARKRLIVLRALAAAAAPLPRAWALFKPALSETRYLVDAAALSAEPEPRPSALAVANATAPSDGLAGIFATLAMRDRLDRRAPPTYVTE
ncbi:MAG: phytoene/squalene synthase family protein [Pikeienuella sp.]